MGKQEELTLEVILDAHAALYARATMAYITSELTEDEREKEFHHSDLKTLHAIQRLINKEVKDAERRAYKQGWDSAGGEAMEHTHQKEVVEARIDEINNVVGNFEFRIETPDSLSFYSKHERIAMLQSSIPKEDN